MTVKPYLQLMRLDKPIGIFLLLWPTLWALWLATAGKPDWVTVLIFVTGVVLMRSAGCVINDIADRNFDRHVTRTQHRPLTAQKISLASALGLFGFLCVLAFLLVLNLNILTIKLAFVGAFLAIIYPFLKRVTHLPQVGLGLAFAWGVPMAFAAELNNIPASAWFLFVTAAVWPVIYDTMYAMVDQGDDEKIGVKSTAILFGKNTVMTLALLQVLFLVMLTCLGILFEMHWPFFLSLGFSAVLFVYQLVLIKKSDPADCFKAFLNNHWIGLIVFGGIVLGYKL